MTPPRWSGECTGCHRPAELETRYEHGARALCDPCAAKPAATPPPPLREWAGGNGSSSNRTGPSAAALLDRPLPEVVDAIRAIGSNGHFEPDSGAEHRRPEADTYPLLDFAALQALPDPAWLIEGVMPDQGLGVLYGPSGSFKSFLALDWLLCVATRTPWHGHEIVSPGLGVYIAAEGTGGLPIRTRAWWEEHGRPDMSRARWLTMAVNFRDREQMAKLRRTLDSLPERPRLLVDDTMARSMVGGDENSSKDVGEFIAAIDSTPANLKLVVHHSGYAGTHERGSSALQGAADFRASVTRRGPLMELTCHKLKDAEEWKPITLRLEPHTSGSCTLSRVGALDAEAEKWAHLKAEVLAYVKANAPVSGNSVRRGVTGAGKAISDALKEHEAEGVIEHTSAGYEVCPEGRDTPGHTLLSAPPEPCPG